MPWKKPDQELLTVENVVNWTQREPTKPGHAKLEKEVKRIFESCRSKSNRDTTKAVEAMEFIEFLEYCSKNGAFLLARALFQHVSSQVHGVTC